VLQQFTVGRLLGHKLQEEEEGLRRKRLIMTSIYKTGIPINSLATISTATHTDLQLSLSHSQVASFVSLSTHACMHAITSWSTKNILSAFTARYKLIFYKA